MKKILLPMVAFMLSATAMNAQNAALQGGEVSAVKPIKALQAPKSPVVSFMNGSAQLKPNMAPAKASELADNQKALGLSGSDNPQGSVGIPGSNASKVAACLLPSDLKQFAGCKVVGIRFGLGYTIGSTTGFLMEDNDTELKYNASGKISNTVASPEQTDESGNLTGYDLKWNYVTFDTPYTIPETPKALWFGYEYTQKADKNDPASMPLLVGITDSQYGLMMYGNLNNDGDNWYRMSLSQTQYGTICAQLIIEKEGGFPDDIVMVGASAEQYIKNNWPGTVLFAAKNIGSKELKDYNFSLVIDDDQSTEQILTPDVALGGTAVTYNAQFSTEGLKSGLHTLKIKVRSMNGGEPTGDTSDDEISTTFHTYAHKADHQKNLIEHFTSTYCTYCPYGYDVLRKLESSRDDVAWVALHGDLSTTAKDPYTLEDAGYITSYSITGYPSANINRTYLEDGSLGVVITYQSEYVDAGVKQLSSYIDTSNKAFPAMVRLDLTNAYDASSKKLTVTVKGTGVEDAAKILSDNTLTLYLTEDGLKSRQLKNGTWLPTYTHNHVLRAIASQPWGDNIVWDGDNFTATYDIDVDDSWKVENLQTVAFVSRPFVVMTNGQPSAFDSAIDAMGINQCQSLNVQEGTATAIDGVNSADNATVVARYAADGSKVSAPVKGVNILKMSDGTTRKVVVNK